MHSQQLTIAQTEDRIDDLYGLDKLKALNRLTHHYTLTAYRKSLKYAKQALALGETILSPANTENNPEDRVHLVQAYYQYGYIHFLQEEYFDAEDRFLEAKVVSNQISDTTFLSQIEQYLSLSRTNIRDNNLKEGLFKKTFGKVRIGKKVNAAAEDVKIKAEIKQGEKAEKNGKFREAIDHYQHAIDLSKNKGDTKGIASLQVKVAALLDSLDQPKEALDFLEDIILTFDTIASTEVARALLDSFDLEENAPLAVTNNEPEVMKEERSTLKVLADKYAKNNEIEKSLVYYNLYQKLSEQIEADSLQALVEKNKRLNEILTLKQQKIAADLDVQRMEAEHDKQVRLRNMSAFIGILLLGMALAFSYFYANKRKQHNKLSAAYEDLNITKTKLEKAEQNVLALLKQQVSGDIATELINHKELSAARHFVCVMFLDIRGFTPIAEKMTPEELITYQNDVFGFMIDIVQQSNGNINQLLGDGFMATFGAPVSSGNDCQMAYSAARKIIAEVDDRNQKNLIRPTKIGIGLHAGFVVTGNVGSDARKQYSVTGNPVIIASRVEQLNKKYNSSLIITKAVYDQLDNPPDETDFKEEFVKGRSEPLKILLIS